MSHVMRGGTMTDTTTARPMRPAHHDDDPPVRGIGHLRHPVVSGGLIGVVGGGAFLFGGIAGLPAEHQGTLRGVAISLISFTLVVVLLRRRMLPTVPTPARGALRVYGIAVVAMLALLPVTHVVALALDAPTAQSPGGRRGGRPLPPIRPGIPGPGVLVDRRGDGHAGARRCRTRGSRRSRGRARGGGRSGNCDARDRRGTGAAGVPSAGLRAGP